MNDFIVLGEYEEQLQRMILMTSKVGKRDNLVIIAPISELRVLKHSPNTTKMFCKHNSECLNKHNQKIKLFPIYTLYRRQYSQT